MQAKNRKLGQQMSEAFNPAMQFISGNEATIEVIEEAAAAETVVEDVGASSLPETLSYGRVPAGFKLNPLLVETKSKRLQLMLQPTLLDKIKQQAQARGKSVNDYVHTILLEAHREK